MNEVYNSLVDLLF